jgi:hypothetical protein
MKPFQIAASLVMCLWLMGSCNKYRQFEPTAKAYVRAEMNGLPWELRGKAYMDTVGRWFIQGNSYEEGMNRESFHVGYIPALTQVRMYGRPYDQNPLLHKRVNMSYNTSQDDGDVACDSYIMLRADSLNCWVVIDRHDTKKRYLEGEFSATFTRNTQFERCNPNAPDTIRMRNGTFRCPFVDIAD